MRIVPRRMCWCASGFACSAADDFRMDIGRLTLLGPEVSDQSRTCVSGQERRASREEIGAGAVAQHNTAFVIYRSRSSNFVVEFLLCVWC